MNHKRLACSAEIASLVAALVVLWCGLIAERTFAADNSSTLDAAQVRSKSAIASGLVIIVGQSDLGLGTELVSSGSYVVQMLVSAGEVDPLRRKALEAGVHGPLAVAALPADGKLPHPSRFADLVIADLRAPGCPAEAELDRIANVRAKLLLRRGGEWVARPRAKEPGIADWSHKWYDATGNNCSTDTKAGPPQTVQWQAGPAFADGSGGGKHPVIAHGAFACVDSIDGSG